MSELDLVVWINGRVYSWAVAGPIVMSLVVFGQPLDAEDIDELVKKHIAAEDAVAAEIFHEKEGTGSWWFFGQPSPSPTHSRPRSRVNSGSSMDLPASATGFAELQNDGGGSVASGDEGMSSDGGGSSSLSEKMTAYSKALTLGSDEIKELNLKPGENKATFTVTSKMQGVSTIQCHIFLWNHDDQVVISDVDGTITRSDLLGHAANLVGRDWTHDGVASLYTSIAKNGYKMMYLTSRSISHAPLTREYIVGLKQDGGVQLPRGPILFSPQNFFMSIHREVIARNPQEFKVACLSSIVNLFPTRQKGPFAAGFGNRHTDEISYRAVQIADDRIFTIDPKGNVKIGAGESTTTKALSTGSSYPQLQKFCDLYFPPTVRMLHHCTVLANRLTHAHSRTLARHANTRSLTHAHVHPFSAHPFSLWSLVFSFPFPVLFGEWDKQLS